MRILKKAKIAGHMFDVKFPYNFTERSDIFGRIDFATNTIYITNINNQGNLCAKTHTEQVLWHEIFHAIDKFYCMDKIGVEFSKEDIIDGLGQGIHQFLTDNFEPLKPKKER